MLLLQANCLEKAAILLYVRVVNGAYILPRKIAKCNIDESFYGDEISISKFGLAAWVNEAFAINDKICHAM